MIEPLRGRRYYYWSIRSDDKKPTKKFCKFLNFAKTEGYAFVEREDLSVHKIQMIKINRLREVEHRKCEHYSSQQQHLF